MSISPDPDPSTITARITDLRKKSGDVSQKVLRLVQGAGSSTDATSIHSDVKTLQQTFQALRKELSACSGAMDPDEAADCDKVLKHVAGRISSIERDYSSFMARDALYTPEVDLPDAPTVESLKLLQQQKEDQVALLGRTVKEIGHGQKRIKEALDEASEVEEELARNIEGGTEQLKDAVGKMQNFQTYLKKNKAPMLVCVLTLILMIVMWASKAFCSWGLTWQCP